MKKELTWKSVITASIIYIVLALFLYYISIFIPLKIDAKYPEESAEDVFYFMSFTPGKISVFLNVFIFLGLSSLFFGLIFCRIKKIRLKTMTKTRITKFYILLIPLIVLPLIVNGLCFSVDPLSLLPYLDFDNIENSAQIINSTFKGFLLHLLNFTVGFLISNIIQFLAPIIWE